jgi:hypothetical protein
MSRRSRGLHSRRGQIETGNRMAETGKTESIPDIGKRIAETGKIVGLETGLRIAETGKERTAFLLFQNA